MVIGIRDTNGRWHQPQDATITENGLLSADRRVLDLSQAGGRKAERNWNADGHCNRVRVHGEDQWPDAAATFLNLNHRKLRIKWDVLHSHGDV